MKKSVILVLAGVVLVLVVAGAALRWFAGDEAGVETMDPDLALAGLREVAERFPPPDEPRSWPSDLGAKPAQFAESWLFAGLLRDSKGQSFGFQLEISRIAVKAEPADRQSAWATSEIYRARFSVEPGAERAHSGERLSRAALGLAGASRSPAEAWVENWRFVHEEAADAFRLEARDARGSIALRLALPEHAPVAVGGELHAGYWWPGLQAAGTLTREGRELAVSGTAFLERLWGKALPAGQGQLALARLWLDTGEGRALRCQQLRRRAGGGRPLVDCTGHPAPATGDLSLEPAEEGWRTVEGVRLPLAWTIQTESGGPVLSLAPLAGEHPLSFSGNWSGIVVAAGDPARWGLLELSNFAMP